MTDRPRSGSIERPGPNSQACYAAVDAHTGGLSSQARLFPVAFQSGSGVYLDDVDGNRYLDFSSGIYVASLGHCHPVVSQAIADAAHQLMNCHDFPTPAARRGPAAVSRNRARGSERCAVLRQRDDCGGGCPAALRVSPPDVVRSSASSRASTARRSVRPVSGHPTPGRGSAPMGSFASRAQTRTALPRALGPRCSAMRCSPRSSWRWRRPPMVSPLC